MAVDLSDLCISSGSVIRQVIEKINLNGLGIALVVDDKRILIGTITDGDVRRAILVGNDLDSPVDELLKNKASIYSPKPITVSPRAERSEMLRLMKEYVIHQLPVLDDDGRVIALVTMDDLLTEEEQQKLPLQAVVMAGGFGTRLRPLTEELPKPLLPVGDRPLLERTIEQLRQAGIRNVSITTHFMAEKIKQHFGDGNVFGVDINYVEEITPLGTAGALGLMDTPKDPLLVINGDILTQVNFRAMLAFHRQNQAALTVAVRRFEFKVPYGVIKSEGPFVKGLSEKPVLNFFVNAGIYLLEPSVYEYIHSDQHLDMTELIQILLDNDCKVASFPIVEYWLDIGQHTDYEQAQQDIKDGRLHS
ncbi:MAG: nucleotidyltransferase family protein [Anaerolineae bacterium]|nr:nucleotidyltransferase family protein [Anaerolineae bacterium]